MQHPRSPWTHWKLWEVGQAAVLRQAGPEAPRKGVEGGRAVPALARQAASVCVLGPDAPGRAEQGAEPSCPGASPLLL